MALSVLLLVVGAYVVHVLAVAGGLVRVRQRPVPPAPDPWPFVSVVIAARNEEEHIRACLDSVLACDYPDDGFEVVVVDDFSSDRTAALVRTASRSAAAVLEGAGDGSDSASSRIRLVKLADLMARNEGHKSEAVARGVAAARGSIVLTTDADCTVAPGWIRSMVRRCTPETPFVAGPVQYEVSHRWFDRLQALAFTSFIAYGAGTIGLGLPTICNSANNAIRRTMLTSPRRVPDGAARDEMLLQHIAYHTDRDVTFNPDPDALVSTAPVPTLRAYLQQHVRWASMSTRYLHLVPKAASLLVWLTYTVLFVGACVALVVPAWQQPVVGALLAKFAADALLVFPLVKHFGQEELIRSAVATELLLLWVVPLTGLRASYKGAEWKGRCVE
jgi:cellulose synthase/poly-beta-1,6-N-acetylglucosamine synthase-like glycosyltransferase